MAMAKKKDSGEFLWGTEVWHARLLEYESKDGLLKRFFSNGNSDSTNKSKNKRKNNKKHLPDE
jgi:hypothetical protein